MAQATDYLIGLGHRRIALITAGPDIRPGRERVRGFTEAFERHGLPVPEDLIRSQILSVDYGFRETSALLQLRDRPTALIAGGNRTLVGALRALQDQHVRVPDDLSLISCDQTDLSRLYPGPITLIDRDMAEIGRTAAGAYLRRNRDPAFAAKWEDALDQWRRRNARETGEAAGLDPDNLPEGDLSTMNFGSASAKAWRDIWGSGQGIGAIEAVMPAADYIARLATEYETAKAELKAKARL